MIERRRHRRRQKQSFAPSPSSRLSILSSANLCHPPIGSFTFQASIIAQEGQEAAAPVRARADPQSSCTFFVCFPWTFQVGRLRVVVRSAFCSARAFIAARPLPQGLDALGRPRPVLTTGASDGPRDPGGGWRYREARRGRGRVESTRKRGALLLPLLTDPLLLLPPRLVVPPLQNTHTRSSPCASGPQRHEPRPRYARPPVGASYRHLANSPLSREGRRERRSNRKSRSRLRRFLRALPLPHARKRPSEERSGDESR